MENIQEVLTLLTQLLQGSPEVRAAARATITAMSSEPQTMTPEEDAEQEEMLANFETKESEVAELLEQDLSNLDPEDHEATDLHELERSSPIESSENSTALVQNDGALTEPPVETVVKGIAFVIIVWLVVSAIVFA